MFINLSAYRNERDFYGMLEAYNIKKYFGERLIISFDEFKLYSGDKIA